MKSMKLLPRAAIPLSVAFIVNLGCVYAGQGVIDLRAVQGGSVKVLEDYSGRPDEHGVMEIYTWQRAYRRFNCPLFMGKVGQSVCRLQHRVETKNNEQPHLFVTAALR